MDKVRSGSPTLRPYTAVSGISRWRIARYQSTFTRNLMESQDSKLPHSTVDIEAENFRCRNQNLELKQQLRRAHMKLGSFEHDQGTVFDSLLQRLDEKEKQLQLSRFQLQKLKNVDSALELLRENQNLMEENQTLKDQIAFWKVQPRFGLGAKVIDEGYKRLKSDYQELVKRKQDLERVNSDLVRANEVLQEANTLLQTENQTMKLHFCPQSLVHRSPEHQRALRTLMKDCWSHFLQMHPVTEYKELICTAVSMPFNSICTHQSIQAGLSLYGFYITHSEALNLIREISKTDSLDENRTISKAAFRLCLMEHQPYQLKEDVAGSIRCLAYGFSIENIGPETLKSALKALQGSLDIEEVQKELMRRCKILQSEKVRNIADFLLKGDRKITGTTLSERIQAALPPWKPIQDLTYCAENLLGTLDSNSDLRSALGKGPGRLKLKEFAQMCERFGRMLTKDEEQFLICMSLGYGLGGKGLVAPVVLQVAVTELLKWSYDRDFAPCLMTPFNEIKDGE